MFEPRSPLGRPVPFWIQGEVTQDRLKVDKVGTKENVADILTKAVVKDVLLQHLLALDIELGNTRCNQSA